MSVKLTEEGKAKVVALSRKYAWVVVLWTDSGYAPFMHPEFILGCNDLVQPARLKEFGGLQGWDPGIMAIARIFCGKDVVEKHEQGQSWHWNCILKNFFPDEPEEGALPFPRLVDEG